MGKRQLFTIAALGAAAAGLDRLFLHTGVMAAFGVSAYLLSIGAWAGSLLLPREKVLAQTFWGTGFLLSCILLLNTAVYYAYRMNEATSWTIFLLPLCVYAKDLKIERLKDSKTDKTVATIFGSFNLRVFQSLSLRTLILFSIFLGCEIFLFTLLAKARTTGVMPSPWQNLGPSFFALYAIATALLFFSRQKILAIPHLFLTYGIAAIIYPLGYGFDGFIHRAAETWIDAHGFIAPKAPFYIGQYGMVVWLHHLTGISIKLIDVFLAPALASIALPGATVYMLRRAWQIPIHSASMLAWLVPAVPFLSFNLTTPHNVVLLLSYIVVCAMISFWHGSLPASIPLVFAAAAVATHPLVGVPVFLCTLGGILSAKVQNKITKNATGIATALAIALAIPAMFTVYLFLTHHGLPQLSNPFLKFSSFVDLFKTPYWHRPHAPLRFELLYAWARAIVPLIGLLGIIGWFTHDKRLKGYMIFPATVIGLWLGAFLLRSWIVFPGVAGAEQGDYPLRLIRTSMLFALPFAMYAIYGVLRMAERKGWTALRYIFPIVFACLLTISLYLSYPQKNPKAQFPGYNVTAHDADAVRWIHDREGEEYRYIVLSNPLPAAAALEAYSFAKYHDTPKGPVFYYSIPSGGPLYGYYLDMVYRGQKRETMEAAMALANVKHAYFILDDYWANAKTIAEGAKKTADEWHGIDGEKVWIFMYNRK